MIVERNKLVGVSSIIEEFNEIIVFHNDGCSIDAWVKTYGFTSGKILIEENMYMVFRIIYQTKRSNRTGCYTKVFLHPLIRSK